MMHSLVEQEAKLVFAHEDRTRSFSSPMKRSDFKHSPSSTCEKSLVLHDSGLVSIDTPRCGPGRSNGFSACRSTQDAKILSRRFCLSLISSPRRSKTSSYPKNNPKHAHPQKMAKRDKKRKQGWEPAAKRGNGPPTTSSSSSKRTQHPDSERTKHKPTTKQQQHQAPHKQKQHQDPTIPFDVHDRILLVGEGDLSFARSVVEHHGCADVLATTLDPVAELLEKYPQAAGHIQYLEDEGQGVMHEVDATKLAQKELRKGQLWDRVVFNFPHVGGRSKDVNRQVRYNQGMFWEMPACG